MDFFAHGAWSFIFFHKIEKPWLAVVFGLLPDIVSWSPLFFYMLFTGDFLFRGQGSPVLPDWVNILYGVGHSLMISLLVIGVVYLIYKKWFIYMFAWPMAIVMDLFTHSRDFLPTPFLWPISDWHFPGVRWGTLEFMIINWSLILISIGCIVYKSRKL